MSSRVPSYIQTLVCVVFTKAAMTKYNRNASPHGSGSSKSTVKVSAGLVFSAASLLGCVLPVFRWPSLCVCVLISTSEDTNHNGLGPSRMTPPFPSSPLARPYFQIQIYSEVLGPQHMNLEWPQFSHNNTQGRVASQIRTTCQHTFSPILL